MKVFYGFQETGRIVKPMATVGSFDGVHQGHREILRQIIRLAGECGGESVVITFHPHPRMVLFAGEGVSLINTLPEKICLLSRIGIDNLIVVDFTRAFSALSPERFVSEYLVGRLHMHTLMVGYDHHFGSNKEGTFSSLETLSREFGFQLFQMPPREVEGMKVSSTKIRRLLEKGAMAEAARYLGEPYFIMARLGAEGRLEGVEPAKLLPPPGEYPVTVEWERPEREEAEGSGIPPTAPCGSNTVSVSALCIIAPGREVILKASGILPAGCEVTVAFTD